MKITLASTAPFVILHFIMLNWFEYVEQFQKQYLQHKTGDKTAYAVALIFKFALPGITVNESQIGLVHTSSLQ